LGITAATPESVKLTLIGTVVVMGWAWEQATCLAEGGSPSLPSLAIPVEATGQFDRSDASVMRSAGTRVRGDERYEIAESFAACNPSLLRGN
jgi:hypothetical protein